MKEFKVEKVNPIKSNKTDLHYQIPKTKSIMVTVNESLYYSIKEKVLRDIAWSSKSSLLKYLVSGLVTTGLRLLIYKIIYGI